jgi:ZIP family zinc transporter
MAVGVLFAGVLRGIDITMAEATALSLGIAIQNFPEGAIISMPSMPTAWGKAVHLSGARCQVSLSPLPQW